LAATQAVKRLLVEREKFAQHVMVSVGAARTGSCSWKRRSKSTPTTGRPMPELTDRRLQESPAVLPTGFIFQQDGAAAHTARRTQDWLQANCPEFIEKNQWPQTLQI